MMPRRHMTGPNRRPDRCWQCDTCGEPLGRIYTTPGGDKLLKPLPALRLVQFAGVQAWALICEHGHRTVWQGAGIRLDRTEDAA